MQSDNEQIIIEENDNVMLIKDINKEKIQYIVCDEDKENIKYFDNLIEASLCYNSKILDEKRQIECLKRGIKQVPHFVTFATILQRELDYDVDEIKESNLKQLHLVYDEYLDTDGYNLISDELYDLAEKYEIEKIREAIIQYLKENNVETDKIDSCDIEEMIEDVVDYAIETDNEPISLIWIEDYLQIKVDELKKEEEVL